jgi:hypothetical protein
MQKGHELPSLKFAKYQLGSFWRFILLPSLLILDVIEAG